MFYKLLNAYTRRFAFPYHGLKYFLKAAKWLGLEDRVYTKKLEMNFYLKVNPSEHIQQQLFWYGCYEKEIVTLIKNTLKPGDVFLDIGANIGYFSLVSACHQPAARVVSLEPSKEVFEKLKENILINSFNNIMAIHAAAGENNEIKELFLSGPDNLGMSSFRQPENYSGKKEEVNVIRLDDWFPSSGLTAIDLVKLDVEGSELSVLKGMEQLLIRFKPLIIAEVNPGTLSLFNIKPADIFSYLGKLHYTGYRVSAPNQFFDVDTDTLDETVNVLFVPAGKKKDIPAYLNR